MGREEIELPGIGRCWKKCPIHGVYLRESLGGKHGRYFYCPIRTCPNHDVRWYPPSWDAEYRSRPSGLWARANGRLALIPYEHCSDEELRAELKRLNHLLFGTWSYTRLGKNEWLGQHIEGPMERLRDDDEPWNRLIWQERYNDRANIKAELSRRYPKRELEHKRD